MWVKVLKHSVVEKAMLFIRVSHVHTQYLTHLATGCIGVVQPHLGAYSCKSRPLLYSSKLSLDYSSPRWKQLQQKPSR
jgi:hypothetical protein